MNCRRRRWDVCLNWRRRANLLEKLKREKGGTRLQGSGPWSRKHIYTEKGKGKEVAKSSYLLWCGGLLGSRLLLGDWSSLSGERWCRHHWVHRHGRLSLRHVHSILPRHTKPIRWESAVSAHWELFRHGSKQVRSVLRVRHTYLNSRRKLREYFTG